VIPPADLARLGVRRAPGARVATRPLDLGLAPVEVAARLARQPGFAWLDSAAPDHPLSRTDLLAFAPWATIRVNADRLTLSTAHGTGSSNDPLASLAAILAPLRPPAGEAPAPGFAGGAIGYLAYDLGRLVERIPDRALDDRPGDDLYLGLHDWVLRFDHATATWDLAATAREPAVEPPEALLDRAEQALRAALDAPPVAGPAGLTGPAVSGFTEAAYQAAVSRALEHIRAGDIYQVNLSQRFAGPVAGPAFPVYRRLRERVRPAFGAYLEAPGLTVLSLSPERFLEVRGDRIETRPIKGTRPRGATPARDRTLAAELLASPKDRAELAMIVDLERNDLGRVARPGSVRVTGHAELYTLPTVHHTVSSVEARLRPGVDVADLLRATFPGGSITGAPKIRAMEIIEALEPCRRGVYTGSVGYLGYDGQLDLSIAIRTVAWHDGRALVHAGGGIVAASDPGAEYEETLDKARALLEGLRYG
jgi:para-aminobenzoate synthetase component 1